MALVLVVGITMVLNMGFLMVVIVGLHNDMDSLMTWSRT